LSGKVKSGWATISHTAGIINSMSELEITPSQRISRLPPYLFGKINVLRHAKRQQGVDIIDLGMGNPSDPAPQIVIDKLCEAARDPRNHRYSASKGIKNLRGEIAKKYERKWNVQLDPETEVLACIGSKEGFSHMCLAMMGPGDTAIVYATDAELTVLRAAGWHPIVLGTQEVSNSRSADRDLELRTGGYHYYAALTDFLTALADDHPDVCRLMSIGKSVHGREIWAVKISDNPDLEEDEPEAKIVSTIHGDENLGTEMCIMLLDLLTDEYGLSGDTGVRVTDLVDAAELWIVPCMNPDGLEARTRYNANGYDLNRSFPDGVDVELGTVFVDDATDVAGRQPEVAAVMQWSAEHSFVLSAGLHTGALLVCYPYGNNVQSLSVDTPTPDDLLFESLARAYTYYNPGMWANSSFTDGIVNGADWYVVTGEMADWNYRYLGTFETTNELSNNDHPDPSAFAGYWDDNRDSMLNYLEQSLTGIRGTVTAANSGHPVWARVVVPGNDHPMFSDPDVGDYHRLLLEGEYALEFAAADFLTRTVNGVPVGGREATRLNVTLTPARNTVRREFVVPAYKPGDSFQVSLQLTVADTPPAAFILTETVPDGWQYMDESTVSGIDAEGVVGPRTEGDTCSWLIWGAVSGPAEMGYELTVPGNAAAEVYFSGSIHTIAGVALSGGTGSCRPLADDEAILRLAAGWNLISVPLRLTSRGLTDLFGENADMVSAWGWNGSFFLSVAEFEPKNGYWVYAEQAVTQLLTGAEETDTVFRLVPGWNLFGPLSDSDLIRSEQILGDTLYWDGTELRQATSLRECIGYWLYCSGRMDVSLD